MNDKKILSANIIKNNDASKNHKFSENILNANIIANVPRNPSDTELKRATQESHLGLTALNPTNALQEMLAAQMLSIHQLQQKATALANKTVHSENTQYFTKAAIKLANCFTQQANTLSKLQGHLSHKITVEHVDVHHGGQAIVGNINGVTPTYTVKK